MKNSETNLFNHKIPNPVGLAASLIKALKFITTFRFGYGFIEVGTVTPKRQLGNSKPRIFNLKDKALINRLGFNNHGSDIVSKRLSENIPEDF